MTELITGIDLVTEQIRVANGLPLRIKQEDVRFNGHAIECRINAEDSDTFMPSPGMVHRFHAPGGPGIRVDTHLYDGYKIPPNYDAMVAKVIAHGPDRATAIARMRVALSELVVEGVKTNTALQQRNMVDQMFGVGGANIHYLERRLAEARK